VPKIIVRSWGSRILGALTGCLLGLALIVGSFVLVFWNEGHGLHTVQALQETEQVLVSVPIAPIDPQNNLRPVYFSGLATTSEVLRDALLGVSQQALILVRTVEMYQWEQHTEAETQPQSGGSGREVKTYTYRPLWSERLIRSADFKEPQGHQNPEVLPFQSRTLQAKSVKVGDYNLPPEFVRKMKGATMLDLSRQNLTALQQKTSKPVRHLDYRLYVGENPQEPEIGDLKITVSEILPQTVSVLAQQTGKTVQPYLAPSGQPVGLLAMGAQAPGQMIQQAESKNRMLTWVFRLLSFFMMFIGFALILRPIVVFADRAPFFGRLIDFGGGLLAFTGGLFLWALATALAWFAVRPVWSLSLILIILLFCYIMFTHHEKQGD